MFSLSPGGIVVAAVQSFDRLVLPWGETIAFPNTSLSLWAAALWTFSLAVYLFVIMGCRRLLQVGRRRAALVMGANVIFFSALVFLISLLIYEAFNLYTSQNSAFYFVFLLCSLTLINISADLSDNVPPSY